MAFTYTSLFSGIGGFDRALDSLGGSCVLASEIDKPAEEAYTLLFGHGTSGDVMEIEAADVPDHDILVGGFPCQAFAIGGHRRGFDDTRGTLFFEMARIAKVKQPKGIFIENVPGLFSHDKGRTLDIMIRTLDEIGYTVDFNMVSSKFFDVPQNRKRIYIMAIRNDLVKAEAWNLRGKSTVVRAKRKAMGIRTFNFNWPEQKVVTKNVFDILEKDVSDKYRVSEKITEHIVIDPPGGETGGLAIKEATKKGYTMAYPGDTVNFQYPKSTTRRGRVGKQVANTLEASGINQAVCLQGPDGLYLRNLTPLEALRLQGFSDEDYLKLRHFSDTTLYKFAGNAVTINTVEALGRELVKMIQRAEPSIHIPIDSETNSEIDYLRAENARLREKLKEIMKIVS